MATEALSEAWFLLRFGRVTGCQVGTALGWFYGVSPEFIWRKIVYGAKEEFSKDSIKNMSWGREHEDDSVFSVENVFCVRVLESPFAIDTRYTWLGATPDGYVPHGPIDNKPFIVECKCPGRVYKTPPLYYMAQMYVQMRTYGAKRVYFSAWTPKHIKIWIVLWEDRFWAYMQIMLMRFWDCVRSNMVPHHNIVPHVGAAAGEWAYADYSDKARADAVKLYGLEDWMLPPRPVYTVALDAEGDFSVEEMRAIILRVIAENKGAIVSKPIKRNKAESETAFVKTFYTNAAFEANVVDLKTEALEKYKK